MTPEKMRALQTQVDRLTTENEALSDSCKAVTANLETCERALKRRVKDLKAARARIKRLEG